MIVLTTSTADQTFSVIPREYVTDAEICIRDESTNEEICVLTTGSLWNTNTLDWQLANYDWEDEVGIVITNDIMYITMNLDLLEGRFYDLKISNTSGTVIFRDKIFCTDQTIDQETNNYYDMNQGLYIENTSGNNDYIIY
jgi:hypothetical protein|tara:strand:- start:2347 stop:2766 length:420 start_codon:yes stop_codon:yes gene_type:complete